MLVRCTAQCNVGVKHVGVKHVGLKHIKCDTAMLYAAANSQYMYNELHSQTVIVLIPLSLHDTCLFLLIHL